MVQLILGKTRRDKTGYRKEDEELEFPGSPKLSSSSPNLLPYQRSDCPAAGKKTPHSGETRSRRDCGPVESISREEIE